MISTPLLLLLAAASYVHSEELTQPAYMTLQPDQRLSINCKVSYSVTSYETAWIRQLAGKGLEWIGHIGIGGGTVYSDKLKNKFSISRDTSSNTITLQGQNLQTEDTAVYYCARDGLGGVASYVFDYWGKGTMVTVSSGGRSAPTSIFAMSQCGSGSDGFLTLGCLTSGFSPADSLKFKWKDPSGNDLTDFIQYPAIGNNGAYTSVSHVRVKTADWSTEKAFTCTVEHPAGSKTETLKKEVVPEHPAALLLTVPTETELDNGTATFICLASNFSPKTYEFKWMHDSTDMSPRATDQMISSTTNNYTALSILKINKTEWMYSSLPIKCEFKQKELTIFREAKYPEYTDENYVEITIIEPSLRDMLIKKGGELQCNAKGRKGFKSIKWMRGNKDILVKEISNEDTQVELVTPISYDEWSNDTVYTCEVEHGLLPSETQQKEYKRQNGGTPQCPSVYLLPPPENRPNELVTLTCYVKNFYPKEVVVVWLADDKPVERDMERTTSVNERDGHFSVYSQLLVEPDEWESGVVYSCLVYHEAIDKTVGLIARTTVNKSQTPNLANLSMNVPSICRV